MSAAAPRPAFVIRPAELSDAAALAEFGARTFYETFAADNTAEDMRLHLASAWSPQLQRAEIADPALDTLLACADDGALAAFAQLRADHAPANCANGAGHRAQAVLRRQSLAWHGPGARAHARGGSAGAPSRRARVVARRLGAQYVRAQAFYRKCGFELVGTQVFVVGTDPQTDHVMLRNL